MAPLRGLEVLLSQNANLRRSHLRQNATVAVCRIQSLTPIPRAMHAITQA